MRDAGWHSTCLSVDIKSFKNLTLTSTEEDLFSPKADLLGFKLKNRHVTVRLLKPAPRRHRKPIRWHNWNNRLQHFQIQPIKCNAKFFNLSPEERTALKYLSKRSDRIIVKAAGKSGTFFKSALLILTVSTNAFHSTNLFCCFSRSHNSSTQFLAPTKGYRSKRQLSNIYTMANSRYQPSW